MSKTIIREFHTKRISHTKTFYSNGQLLRKEILIKHPNLIAYYSCSLINTDSRSKKFLQSPEHFSDNLSSTTLCKVSYQWLSLHTKPSVTDHFAF